MTNVSSQCQILNRLWLREGCRESVHHHIIAIEPRSGKNTATVGLLQFPLLHTCTKGTLERCLSIASLHIRLQACARKEHMHFAQYVKKCVHACIYQRLLVCPLQERQAKITIVAAV